MTKVSYEGIKILHVYSLFHMLCDFTHRFLYRFIMTIKVSVLVDMSKPGYWICILGLYPIVGDNSVKIIVKITH